MSASVVLAKTVYETLSARQQAARAILGRDALTTAEKVLYAHLIPASAPVSIIRGQTTLTLQPDRVAMQDATAQMAILQFMQAGRQTVAVPATVHCDHLIRAQLGADVDNTRAERDNAEVYEFLRSAAAKYGMGFWKPGSGIIHQVVLEQYAFPGGLMLGSDSHTPNAGGLGMIAIGVGGADVADVMAGLPWEVRAPKLIGVRLTGRLSGWTTPKDVILRLCGLLTTKGGANKIVEYFGPGCDAISATGKATITNMGAELGATTSIFPYDAKMSAYLRSTGRSEIADLADAHAAFLRADAEVLQHPENYYDELVEIDLTTLEPHVVGPHTPDRARPISDFAAEIKKEGWPERLSAALIGSCTNSSYEDMERAAHIARQARAAGLRARSTLWITPGSEQVRQTIERDGQLADFEAVGAVTLSNACGPCIGNWDRRDLTPGQPNAILTSFNRNFPRRNDGSADTLAFIASPDVVMALAIAGSAVFNPLADEVADGLKLTPPVAPELPPDGFALSSVGYEPPPVDRQGLTVAVSPDSQRLELLAPFTPWDGQDFIALPVLLKTQGQTTTDHISPAGKDWLPLRGHLSGISHNMLLGAVDADTGVPAEAVSMTVCGVERGASPWALKALAYKAAGQGFVIVGDENYGEGSSREHAAMTPRFLGCKAVLARSFARIHETNLKKQGVLPLTFLNPADYQRISKGDAITIAGLADLAPGEPVSISVTRADGSQQSMNVRHSLTAEQIAWFRAGSAMNAANAPR
ncbi:MAG: aconitate hydratase [Vampirovibrionales bacterium]|nr:aconitate hydratase [Vampirovibrionales bacterium]